MAWVAEVSVSPAEPLGDGATELALELDKVGTVLGALRVSDSECICGAFTTHELFSLEVLRVLSVETVLQSSEVRLLTCVTEVIGTFEYCPL